MTNDAINTATPTNEAIMQGSASLTWAEETHTWAQEKGTWATPWGIANDSLNTGTMTNEAQS